MGIRRPIISLSSLLYQKGIFIKKMYFSTFVIANFIKACFLLINIKSTSPVTDSQKQLNDIIVSYYSPRTVIEDTKRNEEDSTSIINNLLYDEIININARANQDIDQIILYKRSPATIDFINIIVNDKLISEVNNIYDYKSEIYTIYFHNVIPANSSLQIRLHFKELSLLTLNDIFDYDVIMQTNDGFIDSKNIHMGISPSTYLLAAFLSKFKFTILSNDRFESWEYKCNLYSINASFVLRTAYEAQRMLKKFFQENYQLPAINPSYLLGSIINTESFTDIDANNTRLLYELKKVIDKGKEQNFTFTLVREWSYMYLNLVKLNLETWKWIREGLAIYFKYYGTFQFQPTISMHRRFIEEHLQPALTANALQSSNSIMSIMSWNKISLNNPRDSKEVIESKISSLFRMLHLTFGLPIFKNAIHDFYHRGKNSYVTMNDLWDFLQEEIFFLEDIDPNLNIKTMMASWINQAGYPLLTVNVNDCNVILHQSRFFLHDVNNTISHSDNSLWWIPITWVTKTTLNLKSTVPIYWFNQTVDKIMIPCKTNNDWIIFNTARTGFYRVNYDKDSWKRILDTLNSRSFMDIPVVERTAIIDDIISLAKTGHISVETYLIGLEYIQREIYSGPAKIVLKEFINLHEYYSDSDDSEEIDEFIFYIFKWMYDQIGYTKNSTDDIYFTLFRTNLNFLMDDIKFKKCIRSTEDYWKQILNNTISKEEIENKSYKYCSSFNIKLEKYDLVNLDKLSSSSAVERPLSGLPVFCTQTLSDQLKWLNMPQAYNKYSDELNLQVLTKYFLVIKNIGNCGNKGAQLALKHLIQYSAHIKYYCENNQLLFLDAVSSLSQKLIKSTNSFDQLIKLVNSLPECSQVAKSLSIVLENKQFENNFYEKNHNFIVQRFKKFNSDSKKYEFYKYLLQNNISPINYIIKLTPHMNPKSFHFDGETIISAKVLLEASNFYIHFHNLTYKSINLEVDGYDIAIMQINHHKQHQFLEIQISEKLKVQSIINIKIQYKGNIGEEKRGLYRDFYINHLNQTKWFAATNLERASARRMFPCFDDPFFKAVFQLQINRTADFKTVSNTRLESTIEDNGRYIDVFEITQEISTHQVAFVLSEFNSSNQLSETLIWFHNNKTFDLVYPIIQNNKNFFENMEKLVNPKQPNDYTYDDQLAQLKNQLENYGLIAYNKKNVITHPNYVSLFDKLTYITDWTHEMMHRFFRNYLFMNFWRCEWFSRAISYHFLSVGYENDMESQVEGTAIFIVHHLQPSMLIDASPLGATFTQEDYTPKQIDNAYNKFTDDKGMSILRMIEATSGFTNTTEFFKYFVINVVSKKKLLSFYVPKWGDCPGINQFCKMVDVNTFSNTEDSAVHSNDIIKSWLNQKGFPVVHVNIENTTIIISQTPFRYNLSSSVNSEYLWNIPITWTSSINPNFLTTQHPFFLTKHNDSFIIDEIGDNDWIIFNLQQIGYYRVNYSVALWNRIINTLRSSQFFKIHQNNRAAIIDDLFNLARGGYVNYTMALSVVQYLIQEKSYAPWRAALVNFAFLDKRLAANPRVHEEFSFYVKELIKPAYKKLRFNEKDNDGYSKSLLRINILKWACKYNYLPCVLKCLKLFNNWVHNPTNLIPVNIRGIVYCTIIENGNDDNWFLLFNKYMETNYQSEKRRIIKALTCTKKSELLQRLLLYSITRNPKLKIQDSLDIFSAVYSSGYSGVKVTLSFMSQNFNNILDYLGDCNKIKNILKGLLDHITTPKLVREFENFIQEIGEEFIPIKETILLFIAQIQEEILWHNAYFTTISEFLRKFRYL